MSLDGDDRITSVLVMPKGMDEEKFSISMITRKGVVKKVPASQFKDVRRGGIIAIKLNKDDELGWARLVSKKDNLILVSSSGQSIRFKESDARLMGRTATGVRGIRLKKDDGLVGADVVSDAEKELRLLTVSEKGFGKSTKIKEYRLQKRGGSGIKTAKITTRTGPLVAAKVLTPEFEEIIVISKKIWIIPSSVL